MKFFVAILAAVAMASAAYAEDNTATHLRVLHEGHAYAEGSKGGHEYGAGEKEEYGHGSKGGQKHSAGEKEEYGHGSKGGHEYGAGERKGRRNGTNETAAATVPTPAPTSGASTSTVIGAASVAFTAVAAALY